MLSDMKYKKIAIVHDFLSQNGGAEKVLEVLSEMFPDAPIYTLFIDRKKIKQFNDKKIVESFLAKIPFMRRFYQLFLPLIPIAFESFDLREYDLVISSCSAFSKSIITNPETKHVCYCHTPTRYLWSDKDDYLNNLKFSFILKPILYPFIHFLRLLDEHGSKRVDDFIAISKNVENRIKKFYRRDSVIIFPPTDTEKFSTSEIKKNYFITGGRLVSYKKFDLVIRAFNKNGLKLKIFGIGRDFNKLKKIAKANIDFLGFVSDFERNKLISEAKAFINPQLEDFGLTAVEAVALGTPLIAYRGGGALEIVDEGVNGIFFENQNEEFLQKAINKFNQLEFDSQKVRETSKKFDISVFKNKFNCFLDSL
jgi:glycosyltransferase involved in cell wall biosynthesis